MKSTYFLPQGDVDQYVASKQKVDSMPGKVLIIKLFFKVIIEINFNRLSAVTLRLEMLCGQETVIMH